MNRQQVPVNPTAKQQIIRNPYLKKRQRTNVGLPPIQASALNEPATSNIVLTADHGMNAIGHCPPSSLGGNTTTADILEVDSNNNNNNYCLQREQQQQQQQQHKRPYSADPKIFNDRYNNNSREQQEHHRPRSANNIDSIPPIISRTNNTSSAPPVVRNPYNQHNKQNTATFVSNNNIVGTTNNRHTVALSSNTIKNMNNDATTNSNRITKDQQQKSSDDFYDDNSSGIDWEAALIEIDGQKPSNNKSKKTIIGITTTHKPSNQQEQTSRQHTNRIHQYNNHTFQQERQQQQQHFDSSFQTVVEETTMDDRTKVDINKSQQQIHHQYQQHLKGMSNLYQNHERPSSWCEIPSPRPSTRIGTCSTENYTTSNIDDQSFLKSGDNNDNKNDTKTNITNRIHHPQRAPQLPSRPPTRIDSTESNTTSNIVEKANHVGNNDTDGSFLVDNKRIKINSNSTINNGSNNNTNSTTNSIHRHHQQQTTGLLHNERPSSWKRDLPPAHPPTRIGNESIQSKGVVAVGQHTMEKSTIGNAAGSGTSNSSASLVTENTRQAAERNTATPTQPGGILPPELSYSKDRVKPVEDGYRLTLIKNASLSSPLLNGWSLYPHQKRAILRGLVMRRMILALDMGLGKTLIGCVWSKAFRQSYDGQLKVYVICPVSLKKEWKRTAEETCGHKVEDDESTASAKKRNKNKKKGEDIADDINVNVNSNDNDCGDDNPLLRMQICSWAKVPAIPAADVVPNFVVVADEAHNMQSLQSARTKEILKLVSSKRCVGLLLLTGTPMKNGKPLNLFPLLKAVRHPFGERQKAYEIQFCAGQQKSYGSSRVVWDANGSSNLQQLQYHISSHLLHLTKEQCLPDLPKQTRVFQKVPVSARHKLQHTNALTDLARLYAQSYNIENSSEVILAAVQRLRLVGSYAKIDATVGVAKGVLEDSPAVVIFTSFVDIAKIIHKKMNESGWTGELLTGETPAKKRQGMVDNFQNGLSSFFVCTFGAGGVGLTLTASQTVILLDRPWTPGDAQQAEDRVRRIGQTKPVTSVWMVAFDLDEQIDNVLEQKKQTSNAVLVKGGNGNNTNGSTVADAPKISIFQLLKAVVLPASTSLLTNK